jgi:hypothetical protein
VRFRSTEFYWHTERSGDGPSESDSPGESRVSAPINIVPGSADARAQARNDLLGWNKLTVANNGVALVSYVSRLTPMPYPQGRTPAGAPLPNLGELYAATLVNGFGLGIATPDEGFPQGVDYEQYRATLTFSQRRYFVREDSAVLAQAPTGPGSPTASPLVGWPDEGDVLKHKGWAFTRYIEREIQPGGHFITVPSGFCQFTSDGQLLNQSMFWNESQSNVLYRWRLVPIEAIPYAAIFGLMGAIDPEPFDFASTGGTMMFVSCGLRTYPAPSRTWLADLDYHFLYLPRVDRAGTALGPNAALRVTKPGGTPGPVDYEAIVSAGDGITPPIRNRQAGLKVDFASLFRPTQ